MTNLKISGATLNQIPLDWEHNFQNITDSIKEAKKQKIDLLCLPEMCITGYGCEDMFLAEWVSDKAAMYLLKIREYTQGIAVAVGLPFIANGKIYNTSCLIAEGKILGWHAKRHLANDGIHYEKRWFTPWREGEQLALSEIYDNAPFGDVVISYEGHKIGFEICEDAWHENSRPGHALLRQNADIILNPSASHFSFDKWKTREELVLSSSEKFDCTYVYVNLLGNEAGRAIYDGDVYIAQKGKMIAQNLRFSFLDFDLVTEETGVHRSFETKEEEFVQVESLALFDYMRKSRSNGFVLSLSGGADSTTCAVLVAEMWKRAIKSLGMEGLVNKLPHFPMVHEGFKKVLTCAYQGTTNSSKETLEAASALANEIGAVFYQWKIDSEVLGYTSTVEEVLGRKLTWESDDITLQNIQARARSPIIWMLANINNALLLATSNRSEASVGYATMDGDTSGSISPLAGIDKDFIRKWLIWAEKQLGYSSLKYVNSLEPTAELRPLNQKQEDEKDLMPYDILNEIERLLILEKLPSEEVNVRIIRQFEVERSVAEEYVRKFTRLWTRNQWKRERYAPAFHVDDYNVDSRTWMRFPILSGGF